MGRDAKNRTIIKVLLIVFSILALTGLGILVQTFVRQNHKLKAEQQKEEMLKKEIETEQDNFADLQKKEKVLRTQIKDAKEKAEKKQQQQQAVQAGLDTLPELESQVQEYMADKTGTWSVYVKNLSTAEAMAYQPQSLKGASLLKLYIMGTVYDQIEKGELSQTEEIQGLLENMITVSDNESANRLVEILGNEQGFDAGAEIVNDYIHTNGYTQTTLGHDFQAERTESPANENMTSVLDCGKFLENIYNGTNVSEKASEEMLSYLREQQRTGKIPAGLPEGVTSANKTGEITGTENDVAIVYAENGIQYILCVMSQDISDSTAAQTVIKDLSSLVYNYFTTEETEQE